MLKKNYSLVLAMGILVCAACNPLNKILKSKDNEAKYNAAVKYYEQKKYVQSLAILEELRGIFRGSDKIEKINYMYAYCNYYTNEELTAAYYFNDFVRQFPRSAYAEECQFMTAFCYYKLSPEYSLDQTYTRRAVEYFQFFISTNPNSKRVEECNNYIFELREKLAHKSFETAELYFKLSEYKAAIGAYHILLKSYPDTKFREDALFKIVKSSLMLADQSVPEKQKQRYEASIQYYQNFADKYPNSLYIKEAESLYDSAVKSLQKIKGDK